MSDAQTFDVGDLVFVRMLGYDVGATVTAKRLGKRGRLEYQVEIPQGLETNPGFSPQECAYVRLIRSEGGFWYYATQIESIAGYKDGQR